jgi:hypothetical protein
MGWSTLYPFAARNLEYTSVAVWPFGCPTWSPAPDGYGNMSRIYAFLGATQLKGGLSAAKVEVLAQNFCHFGSIDAGWYIEKWIETKYSEERVFAYKKSLTVRDFL